MQSCLISLHPNWLSHGISDKAHIGKDVTLGENVVIMPFAVVDDHAVIESNVVLYPHTYIGQYAEIGRIQSSTLMRPFVSIVMSVNAV